MALGVLIGTWLTAAGPALAQAGPTTTVSSGSVISTTLTVGSKPLDGVDLVVRKDGKEIGRASSNASGVVEVTVPGGTQYEVTLDPSTIPKGVMFVAGARTVLKPFVQASGRAPLVFQLTGKGVTAKEAVSRFDRLANLFASGLRFGLVIALASVGLSIIFGTTGLTNFAHGELVTFGAVATWYFNDPGSVGLPLVVAALCGVVAAGCFGATLELGLFRPLRKRGMPDVAAMVVSIGLAFVLRYVLAIVFGANPKQYAQFAAQSPTIHLGPIDLRPKDLVVMGVSLAMLVVVGLFLQRSRLGTAIRAVSDNRDLAESSGIDVQRVILTVWVLSGALAGLGGTLIGLTDTVSWNMGQRILLVMFAAVVLGGLGTAFGAMAGGLLVGLVSDLSTYWLDSDLRIVVALAALIIVLLVRPTGIFGTTARRA